MAHGSNSKQPGGASRATRSGRTFCVACKDGRIGGVIEFEQASPVSAIMHVLSAPGFCRSVAPRRGTGGRPAGACSRPPGRSRSWASGLAIAWAVRYCAWIEGTLRSHTLLRSASRRTSSPGFSLGGSPHRRNGPQLEGYPKRRALR